MKRIYTILTCLLFAIGIQAQHVSSKSEADVYNDGKHRGLDFSLKTGVHIGVGDAKGTNFIPVELSLGKQFHPNLYLGLGSGVWIGTKGADPLIPITADSKIMFPLQSSKLKPIINFRLGYMISLDGGSGEQTIEDDYGYSHNMPSVKTPDLILMELMPGIQFPVSPTADFMLSAGYTHGFATKGSGNSGFFSVKAGINFHRDSYKKGPKREKVPTRNKGLQFTLEGGGFICDEYDDLGAGANLACTYKLNPYLSVGGGIGYSNTTPFEGSDGHDIQHVFRRGENVSEYYYAMSGSLTLLKLFARATYRPFKNRFSPIVSVDLGANHLSFDEDVFGEAFNYIEMDILEQPSEFGCFITPSIGFSLRTTKNSYLELKAGYQFNQKIKGQKTYRDNDYYSVRDKSISSPMFTLGFTHTFGKRGKRLR